MKTLDNTTAEQAKDKVKDIKFWGDGDTFKLISKASSVNEGWMKSTKAMEIVGVGCVVQVSTQQIDKNIEEINFLNIYKKNKLSYNSSVAEAIVFVPNVKILETKDDNGIVISRKLIDIQK